MEFTFHAESYAMTKHIFLHNNPFKVLFQPPITHNGLEVAYIREINQFNFSLMNFYFK